MTKGFDQLSQETIAKLNEFGIKSRTVYELFKRNRQIPPDKYTKIKCVYTILKVQQYPISKAKKASI